MLSDTALQEFKKMLHEDGVEIPDKEATELALNLLTYFDRIYRPVKREWLKRLIKKDLQKNGK